MENDEQKMDRKGKKVAMNSSGSSGRACRVAGADDPALNLFVTLPSNPHLTPRPLITRNFLDNLDKPINQQPQPQPLHQANVPHQSNPANVLGDPLMNQLQQPQQQHQGSRPSTNVIFVHRTPTPVRPSLLKLSNVQGFPPMNQQQQPQQQQQQDSRPSGSNTVFVGNNAVVRNNELVIIIPHPPEPLNELKAKGILSVSGEAICRACKIKNIITIEVQSTFQELTEFIRNEKAAMNNVAHAKWDRPTLPTCGGCGCTCDIIVSKDYIGIDWLFLLLAQLIGVCTEEQLKVHCTKRGMSSAGNRLELLYRVYMNLCRQLDPADDDKLFQ